jgi:hypothetical protein
MTQTIPDSRSRSRYVCDRSLASVALLTGTPNATANSPASAAATSLLTKEIPRILCKQKMRFRVANGPSAAPVLRQISPEYVLRSYFCKTHFNISLTSTPKSSKLLVSFRSPRQNSVCTSALLQTRHVLCQIHPPAFVSIS